MAEPRRRRLPLLLVAPILPHPQLALDKPRRAPCHRGVQPHHRSETALQRFCHPGRLYFRDPDGLPLPVALRFPAAVVLAAVPVLDPVRVIGVLSDCY